MSEIFKVLTFAGQKDKVDDTDREVSDIAFGLWLAKLFWGISPEDAFVDAVLKTFGNARGKLFLVTKAGHKREARKSSVARLISSLKLESESIERRISQLERSDRIDAPIAKSDSDSLGSRSASGKILEMPRAKTPAEPYPA